MRELQPKTSQNHQDRNEKWVKNKDQKWTGQTLFWWIRMLLEICTYLNTESWVHWELSALRNKWTLFSIVLYSCSFSFYILLPCICKTCFISGLDMKFTGCGPFHLWSILGLFGYMLWDPKDWEFFNNFMLDLDFGTLVKKTRRFMEYVMLVLLVTDWSCLKMKWQCYFWSCFTRVGRVSERSGNPVWRVLL